MDEFFAICPEDILPFTPKLLEKVLPILAHQTTSLAQTANNVNDNLMKLVLSIPPNPVNGALPGVKLIAPTPHVGSTPGGSINSADDRDPSGGSNENKGRDPPEDPFDYATTVDSLTLQFLHEHEETRVAAFDWLIMLHQKAPNKVTPP